VKVEVLVRKEQDMKYYKTRVKIMFHKFIILSVVFTILLLFFNINYGQVLGTHQYNTGSDTITTLDAGECIEIPQEIPQSGGSWESAHGLNGSWSTTSTQYQINQIWNEQGQTYDTNHWAYVETNSGEKRYLVALSSIYGKTGSYVDIYVNNNGTEAKYPCIMGDAKNANDSTTHWWPNANDPNRVTYGHQRRKLWIFKCCRSNVRFSK